MVHISAYSLIIIVKIGIEYWAILFINIKVLVPLNEKLFHIQNAVLERNIRGHEVFSFY